MNILKSIYVDSVVAKMFQIEKIFRFKNPNALLTNEYTNEYWSIKHFINSLNNNASF